MSNACRLRQGLEAQGFTLLGQPSAILPALLGQTDLSRLMTRYAIEAGGIVNLVEHPAVARNACRWRLQIMADHADEHIDRFVRIAVAARAKAKAHIRWLEQQDDLVSALGSDAA